jgi:hypothetical protein
MAEISQFRWNDISNTPTTLVEYGITDAMSNLHISNGITQDNIQNWNNAYYHTLIAAANEVEWNNVINKPTTLAGYGITDGGSTVIGSTVHSALSNLDYDTSGHTGFQPTLTNPVTGTGTDNQIVIFTGATSVEGIANITYTPGSPGVFHIDGDITASGEISAFSGSAPTNWWDSIPHAAPGVRGAVLPDNIATHFLSGLGTWVTVTSGTMDHTALSNLTYAASGHTGFAASSHAHAWGDLTSGVPTTFAPTAHNNTAHTETYLTSATQTSHTDVVVDGDFISQGIMLRGAISGSYSILTNSSANWDTAYTDRNKWDGGSTGLTAATGRTSLGATTVGDALFTLTNPSAITFIRINANNTITAQTAANFKTDLSLDNVTNESKATMFASPTFTGTVAGVSATHVGLGNVTNESKATMFTTPAFTGNATFAGEVGLLSTTKQWSIVSNATPFELQIKNASDVVKATLDQNGNLFVYGEVAAFASSTTPPNWWNSLPAVFMVV